MTLDETVDRFINKAQGKIGKLGDEIVYKKMNDDDCYEKQLFLIEELSAAIGLLQCCCSTSSETGVMLDVDGSEELDVDGSTELETVSVEGEDTCDILTENEKYQIMSYLIDKAELDSMPLFPYGSICVSNVILTGGVSVSSGGNHNSLTGLQGLGTDYFHLTTDEYAGLVKNKSGASGAPLTTDNLSQGWKATAIWLTVSKSMFVCETSTNSAASWLLIFGSGA